MRIEEHCLWSLKICCHGTTHAEVEATKQLQPQSVGGYLLANVGERVGQSPQALLSTGAPSGRLVLWCGLWNSVSSTRAHEALLSWKRTSTAVQIACAVAPGVKTLPRISSETEE